MNLFMYFVVLLVAGCVLMALVWEIQRRTQNAGWVDVAWSGFVGVLALIHASFGSGALLPRLLLALLAGIWALRLASHLAARVAGEKEDGRYQAMRQHWGEAAQRNLFWFFQAQALVAVVLSLPFWAVAQNPQQEWNIWLIAAIVVWLGSVGGEALADRQLKQFIADPENRGKTCRVGLWGWSRHPNYFFEWLHWFTYVLLAIGSFWWWLSLIGPAMMFAFLYFFTGIPHTEKQALKHRSEYRQYQKEVSAFIPLPPDKSA